ncbi:unnamed protein product [Rangifer tarandus platyrhynchus]|uniref:Uncharacterized protein n=1 Tax=Rangifer tarandus platyrhynchus TaxID=3082113 RepID=A0AC59YD66_RANTA
MGETQSLGNPSPPARAPPPAPRAGTEPPSGRARRRDVAALKGPDGGRYVELGGLETPSAGVLRDPILIPDADSWADRSPVSWGLSLGAQD